MNQNKLIDKIITESINEYLLNEIWSPEDIRDAVRRNKWYQKLNDNPLINVIRDIRGGYKQARSHGSYKYEVNGLRGVRVNLEQLKKLATRIGQYNMNGATVPSNDAVNAIVTLLGDLKNHNNNNNGNHEQLFSNIYNWYTQFANIYKKYVTSGNWDKTLVGKIKQDTKLFYETYRKAYQLYQEYFNVELNSSWGHEAKQLITLKTQLSDLRDEHQANPINDGLPSNVRTMPIQQQIQAYQAAIAKYTANNNP